MPAADIRAYARSVHSQSGEDGILEEIFRRLGVEAGYFVEFGAWDGKYLSNTYNLLEKGWRGLYIEGNPKKFQELRRNFEGRNVTLVNRFVAIEGADCLDNILAEAGAPKDIDVLSIDIDSDDLAIFMSLRHLRAKCVVIEFNPSIPFDTEYVNRRGLQIGNAALSIKKYAESIGYGLVAMTATNLVLLDNGCIEKADFRTVPLERTPESNTFRYFFGMDGTLVCLDPRLTDEEPEVFTIPWQSYRIHQPIPRWLRSFDRKSSVRALQIVVSMGALALTRPGAFFGEVRRLFRRVLSGSS